MANKHDKLQSECYLWFHNTFPEYRNLMFSVNNNLTTQDKAKGHIIMAQLKALGVSKGVLDLIFYWDGCLYAFDIKVGSDRLKTAQIEFIDAITAQGGYGCEIRSFEEFKDKIYAIIEN